MRDQQDTSYTLLARALDGGDDQAWNALVAHYKRFIFYVLDQLNVPASDHEDISQQVLIKLHQELDSYDRKRARFRTWLSRVIRNAAFSHFRQAGSQQKRVEGLLDEVNLESVAGRNDIELFIEQEWETYIAEQAMEKVRQAFRGQTIEVFELVLAGRSVPEIVKQTGLAVASIYTIRKRVKKRLYYEIVHLIRDLEP